MVKLPKDHEHIGPCGDNLGIANLLLQGRCDTFKRYVNTRCLRATVRTPIFAESGSFLCPTDTYWIPIGLSLNNLFLPQIF